MMKDTNPCGYQLKNIAFARGLGLFLQKKNDYSVATVHLYQAIDIW